DRLEAGRIARHSCHVGLDGMTARTPGLRQAMSLRYAVRAGCGSPRTMLADEEEGRQCDQDEQADMKARVAPHVTRAPQAEAQLREQDNLHRALPAFRRDRVPPAWHRGR